MGVPVNDVVGACDCEELRVGAWDGVTLGVACCDGVSLGVPLSVPL